MLHSESHRRTFTAREVERMVQTGVLGEDEHVELIEGELIVMSPQGPLHSWGVTAIGRRLDRAYESAAHARIQLPLALDEHNLPEPDVAIVRGEPEAYRATHPTGAAVILVVEVAVSSQAIDRAKATPYARAGVPTYWLVDLEGKRIEERTSPSAEGRYEVTRLIAAGERLTLPVIGQTIEAADLLGR